jgi:hypothetical protein
MRIAKLCSLLVVTLARLSQPCSAQSPELASGVPGVTSTGNTVAILFPIVNSGGATAGQVTVTSASLHGLNPTPAGALPVNLGDLMAGATSGLNVAFANGTLVAGTKYLFTVRGTYGLGQETLGFGLNRFITYGVPSVFQQPPNPINVSATVDTAHSVSGLIAAKSGGSLTTKGADGSEFTLSVPANALLGDQPVTMTPILSVAGLPLSGGFGAAVQLSPEGLVLLQPATLTIKPARQIPVAQQTGFAYHGSGQDFYLYPLNSVNTVTLSLVHFSGYGVGSGTAPTFNPSDALAELQSAIAALAAAERARVLMGEDPDPQFIQEELDLIQQCFLQVIQPLLEQAKNNLADQEAVKDAIGKALGWERIEELLGASDDKVFQQQKQFIHDTIDAIEVGEFNLAYEDCIASANPILVADMVGVVRYFALVGGDLQSILGADYWNKVNKCANQKLTVDFDSQIKGVYAGPILGAGVASTDSVVQATGLSLKWNNAGGDPTQAAFQIQSAPMEYVSLSYTLGSYSIVRSCASITSYSATISVRARPSINLFGKPFGKAPPPSMVTDINVTSDEELLACDCDPAGCFTAPFSVIHPYYSVGWTLIGGREPFEAPLNATTTFSGRTGSAAVGGGSSASFTESTTTVTVNSNPAN